MGISREQALDCFRSDDLLGIGMEADAVRRRLHPEGVVGYVMQALIDCTLSMNEFSSAWLDHIYAAICEAEDKGVCSLRLQGCGDGRRLDGLLRGIRKSFPSMWIEALSAAEVRSLAKGQGLGLPEMLARLVDAGLNSIVNDGLLLGREPALATSSTVSDWLEFHRTAHGLGMQTVAGMIFGAGETVEQRMDFLQAVGELQQDTGGFDAFMPIATEAPDGRKLDRVTAVVRLKTLAITRMVLDNIGTVQAGIELQDLKILQTCLRFGANDLGIILPIDSHNEEDISRVIRDAGFRPVQRTMGYRAMLLA